MDERSGIMSGADARDMVRIGISRRHHVCKHMIYGTYRIAKEYMEKGNIAEWMQLFLRNDGKNIALADGLLLEERHYIGLREIPIRLLADIKSGAPEYLKDEGAIRHFFEIVDGMKQDIGHWDAPPLIVNYADGKFEVNDGRHRLEMYRQLQRKSVYAVLWVTGDEDYNRLNQILDSGTIIS